MKRLEVSGAVRPLYGSLGVKGLIRVIVLCLTLFWVVYLTLFWAQEEVVVFPT